MDIWALIGLAVGLGLLGFIEPCMVGAHLLFVGYLTHQPRMVQVLQMLIFAVTRMAVFGALGSLAVLVGQQIFAIQRGLWIALGISYVIVGSLYLLDKQGVLMQPLGLAVHNHSTARQTALLGVLFGLNVPACAAPLLLAILGASLGMTTAGQGFLILAVFGAALSLPLVALVLAARTRAWLVRLRAVAGRLPRWTGLVFVMLGVGSIALGFAA